MSDGSGYKIPQNVTPSEKDCVTFFFPDDPEYRRIIIGRYQDLGYWFNWERDDNKTGRTVANLWKDCIEMSHECDYMPAINNNITVNTGDVTCGGSTTTVNNELGVAPITITINESTNLEDEEPTNETIYNENGGETDPPEDYVDTYPDWPSFNDAKCRAANYFADRLISQLNRLRFIFDNYVETGVAGIINAISLALADGPSPALDVAAIAILVVPGIITWIKDKAGDTSDLGAFLLTMDKCDISDIIYNSTTRQNLGQAINTYLINQINASSMGQTTKDWLIAYVNYSNNTRFSNWVYDNIDVLVPDDYPIECPCGVVADPEYSGWEFNVNGLQGWNVTGTNISAIDVNPTGDLGITSGTLGYVGHTPDNTSIVAQNIFERSDLNVLITADHGIGWGAFRNGGTSICEVEFMDGTIVTGPTQNNGSVLPYGLQRLDISSYAGKTLNRIKITVNSSLSFTGRRMAISDIIIGNSFGNRAATHVIRTS